MRRPAATVLLLGAVLAAAAAAPAQTPFAMQGPGQNVATGTARDTGRGGWGMADTDTLVPGTLNPAALADLRFAGLVFSGYGERVASEGRGLERTSYRTYLPNVRVVAPLRAGRLALHAGFDVRRSMQWDSQRELDLDHFGREVLGRESYEREGTLFAVPIGLSWRASSTLAVGVTANLIRGTIDEQLNQVLGDSLGGLSPNIRQQRDELTGANVTLAALWSPFHRLSLGASYTTPYDLTFEREVNLGGVGERFTEEFTASMPAEYRAGLMLRITEHWRLGADGQLARYSELTGRADWESFLRDEWTLAAGLERPLVRAARGRGYSPPLRFGFQWRQWAHAVSGSPVHERVVSVGTGFPFQNRLGMIDLSLSYAWIGDLEDNGYRSSAWRLGVSITGLEQLVF